MFLLLLHVGTQYSISFVLKTNVHSLLIRIRMRGYVTYFSYPLPPCKIDYVKLHYYHVYMQLYVNMQETGNYECWHTLYTKPIFVLINVYFRFCILTRVSDITYYLCQIYNIFLQFSTWLCYMLTQINCMWT